MIFLLTHTHTYYTFGIEKIHTVLQGGTYSSGGGRDKCQHLRYVCSTDRYKKEKSLISSIILQLNLAQCLLTTAG